MIALAGGIVGMAIAAAGSKLLIDYAAHMTTLAAGIRLDGRVLLFGLGLSLLAGLLFGVLPGYFASRVRLTSLGDAGESTAGSEGGTRMRSLLVTAQVTISFVLLICAGLMVRSLYNLLSVDPGFKRANVLSMQISLNWTKYQKSEASRNFFHQTLDRVQATPGVQGAAMSMAVPLNNDMGPMNAGVVIEGQPLHPNQPRAQGERRTRQSGLFPCAGNSVARRAAPLHPATKCKRSRSSSSMPAWRSTIGRMQNPLGNPHRRRGR